MRDIPAALTIAGSDSGGGAGLQADLLTFAACGVFATSAATCLTAQNPAGVTAIHAVPPEFVREQAEQIVRHFPVRAIKTGMLLNAGIIRAVAAFLRDHPEIPVVLDPVMIATSGARLLETEAVDALIRELAPRAALITPNLDEAALLLGAGPLRQTRPEDARALARRLGAPVLLKGGHAESGTLTDLLAMPDGTVHTHTARRHPTINTHGSGCTLASAIAAHLALGKPLPEAVAAAHAYLQGAIARPLRIAGESFIAHLPRPGA